MDWRFHSLSWILSPPPHVDLPQGRWGVLITRQLASLPAGDSREPGRGCHVFNEPQKSHTVTSAVSVTQVRLLLWERTTPQEHSRRQGATLEPGGHTCLVPDCVIMYVKLLSRALGEIH